MPDRGRERYLIKSLVHAAGILQAFKTPGEDLRLREVVERSGLAKGTCFRLLHTLHHCGFVEKYRRQALSPLVVGGTAL